MLIPALKIHIVSSTTFVVRLVNSACVRTIFTPVICAMGRNNRIRKKFKLLNHYKSIIRQSSLVSKFLGAAKSKKLKFTHFISIPTNSECIKENFLTFKKNLLENCDLESSGFSENMFQKPEKLHLTICMLHLLNECDEQKAIEALNSCKKDIIDPVLNEREPLMLEFKGLKCMGKNPSKAKVLYIDVQEETGFLKEMAEAMSSYFIQQGLSRKEHDGVTLHLTVINNVFHQRKSKQKKLQNHFDATNILKDYGDVDLGKLNLSTFHLSQLQKKSPDGYYEASAKIDV